MTVFYCDLDNTLIYSQRHDIGPAKVSVETYQGKEISFMTTTSLALLAQVREQVLFVPTTTRTPEQYARVRLGEPAPEYALVCNGGILLRHGVLDDDWYQQTLGEIAPCNDELVHAEALLQTDKDRNFELRFLYKLFLYTKSAKPSETADRLRARLDAKQVAVFVQGEKVYVLPHSMTKAYALARLNRMLGDVFSLAAGDSLMDLGMLNAADQAFLPQALANTIAPSKHMLAIPDAQVFSDVFLQRITEQNWAVPLV